MLAPTHSISEFPPKRRRTTSAYPPRVSHPSLASSALQAAVSKVQESTYDKYKAIHLRYVQYLKHHGLQHTEQAIADFLLADLHAGDTTQCQIPGNLSALRFALKVGILTSVPTGLPAAVASSFAAHYIPDKQHPRVLLFKIFALFVFRPPANPVLAKLGWQLLTGIRCTSAATLSTRSRPDFVTSTWLSPPAKAQLHFQKQPLSIRAVQFWRDHELLLLTPLSPADYLVALRRVIPAPYLPSDLRSTFASVQHILGLPRAAVSTLLRHAGIRPVKHYIFKVPEAEALAYQKFTTRLLVKEGV